MMIKFFSTVQMSMYYFSIMGHGEEEGIIPRFCSELFHKIQLLQTSESEEVSSSYHYIRSCQLSKSSLH